MKRLALSGALSDPSPLKHGNNRKLSKIVNTGINIIVILTT